MSEVKHTFLSPGIVYIPRAVAKEVCDEIVDAAEAMQGWVPARSGIYSDGVLMGIDVYGERRAVKAINWIDTEAVWFKNISAIVNTLAMRQWSITISEFSRCVISKYGTGPGLEDHADTGVYNTNRILTVILYLNSNFSGGEIVFPRQNIEFSPRQGDIVIFFSEYIHAVKPVTHGDRYVLVFFGENNMVTNYRYPTTRVQHWVGPE